LIAAMLALGMGGVWLGAAMVARHRAQSAADLAALAAAARLPAGPVVACREAVAVAGAMRATVRACDVEGLDVVVTVTTPTGVRLMGLAGAAARAGPAVGGPAVGG
jgi:secretion/DNA translocation related TadE-like protein